VASTDHYYTRVHLQHINNCSVLVAVFCLVVVGSTSGDFGPFSIFKPIASESISNGTPAKIWRTPIVACFEYLIKEVPKSSYIDVNRRPLVLNK
jgi:hypothetical protein